MAKAESKETVGKRLRVTDLIPRICCVFFALVIWLYAMSSDSPDYESTFSGVTVSVERSTSMRSLPRPFRSRSMSPRCSMTSRSRSAH